MNHIPFTILAYFFNATSTTIDKFMLIKHIPNPLIYIFYISVFSLVVLLLLPFTHIPRSSVFILASISTLLWTTGAYFMFKALQVGQASRIIPVIGTLIPIILLFEAIFTKTISQNQILAIFLLVLGLVALTIMDWRGHIKKGEILFEVFSALLFALSYIILRQAYLQTDFLTVLVWSRFILVPLILIILLLPKLRQIVFSSGLGQPDFSLISKSGLLFLAGQSAGGLSELLITFSISLATPALVNSLQGSQYAFLFIFSIFLSKRFPGVYQERLSLPVVVSKIIGIILIAVGLYLLAK